MSLTQEEYWGALANPAGLRAFLTNWAAGAPGVGIKGANNVGESSYEQVLADLASRGFDLSGLAQHVTPAAAATPQSIGQLDPAYEAWYQNALRELNTGRDTDLATNEYSRFLAEQQGQRQLGQLEQDWNTKREHLPGSYVQRGVFGKGSGIYQQGLQDYARNRGTAQGAATDAYNTSIRSYDLAADRIRRAAQSRTLDLDSQRQGRYQGLASSLANAKPFTV